VHNSGLADPSTKQNYAFAVALALHAPFHFQTAGGSHCLPATRLALRTSSASPRQSRDQYWHRFPWGIRISLLAPAQEGRARKGRRGSGLVFSYYFTQNRLGGVWDYSANILLLHRKKEQTPEISELCEIRTISNTTFLFWVARLSTGHLAARQPFREPSARKSTSCVGGRTWQVVTRSTRVPVRPQRLSPRDEDSAIAPGLRAHSKLPRFPETLGWLKHCDPS
jgi:hypothetical protein